MGKYFGTDGFRGEVNRTLTVYHAFEIGRYLGASRSGEVLRVAIGKDTRRSSYMIEYALAAGLTSSGADAYLLHVTTTSSVSYAVRTEGFDLGIMISASHNPYYDNGIKLIGPNGEKLSESVTDKIEKYLDGTVGEIPLATGKAIGRTVDFFVARNRYVGYLISLAKHSYRRIKIGLDCANGSTWMLARSVFEILGAEVHVIGAEPDGFNINESCGSTHIDSLRHLVIEQKLDIGFAFDGDGDRCIAVCENGDVLDGDRILYICARQMRDEGELSHNTVVATVMSNIGLSVSLEQSGIECVCCDVGDRYVYRTMKEGSFSLGGEESGHIIFSKYATTGDGLITALKLMDIYIESGKIASRLSDGFVSYPQITVNVSVNDKHALISNSDVLSAIHRERELLSKNGRVLVRQSGTENVIRIMTEADDEKLCKSAAERIAEVIRRKNDEI